MGVGGRSGKKTAVTLWVTVVVIFSFFLWIIEVYLQKLKKLQVPTEI